MVLVEVRLRLFDSIMEGHLDLSNHEGRRMICAKHFHRVGSAVQPQPGSWARTRG